MKAFFRALAVNSAGQANPRAMSGTRVRMVPSPLVARSASWCRGCTSASLRGPQASSHENSVRSERQRGGESTPIGDSSRSEQQRFGRSGRDEVCAFRHEGQRSSHLGSMSAGLSALRDNDGGARIDRDSHVIEVLALADQRNVGFVDLSLERHRIAEREHKRRRFPRQSLRHDLRRALGGPSNESDANTLVGCSIELLSKPRCVAVSATDQPERTRSTDRSRQGAAASKRHRGRDDRMGDAKRLGEPSRNHPATISTAICADKRETPGRADLPCRG